jgi:NAD(P)-dependent dehydrogenase (short-subunit alcohol dehydrogenase family)
MLLENKVALIYGAQLPVDSLFLPITTYMKAHFVTARASARHMIEKRSGVILTITSTPARMGVPLVGGMVPAWGAVEALTRGLSAELGPLGVRVVCLRPHAIPGPKRSTKSMIFTPRRPA